MYSVVVVSRNLMNEEALAQLGLSRQKQTNKQSRMINNLQCLPKIHPKMIMKKERCKNIYIKIQKEPKFYALLIINIDNYRFLITFHNILFP